MRTQEYKEKVDLRNKATQIRRNITLCKEQIKDASRILDQCKSDESKIKWLDIIETYKASRDIWQQQFKELAYESKD